MTRPNFDQIKPDIFRGESRGDYDALWNYQNRPGGDFENIKITDMTVDEALHFSSSAGSNYGNYVRSSLNKIKPGSGRYATPMGAYQVVGNTLKMAKKGLGLSGGEKMTPALQDLIGKYIYDVQGTDAWAGYQGPRYGPKKDRNMMQPDPPPAEQPGIMGLISKGLQNKDLMNRLALGFNTMRLNPDPNLAAGIRESMSDRRERTATAGGKNATVAHLRKIGATDPYALELADAVETGGISPKAALTTYYQTKMSGQNTQRSDVYKVPEGTVTVSSKKNGETEYRLNGRLITDPTEIEDIMSQANLFEVAQAADIQGAKTEAQKEAENLVTARKSYRTAVELENTSVEIIDRILNNAQGLIDGIGPFVGGVQPGSGPFRNLSKEAQDFILNHTQLMGTVFTSVFEALKGGGSITENETNQAKQAAARMNTASSPAVYIEALREYRQRLANAIIYRKQEIDGVDPTRTDTALDFDIFPSLED